MVEFLRALRGRRQRAGGSFQFGRGRRHGFDDLADRALEIVGELDHVGLALFTGALIRRQAIGAHSFYLNPGRLEHRQRQHDLADFITAARLGCFHQEVAAVRGGSWS